jgi:iron(III) transport system permease protein
MLLAFLAAPLLAILLQAAQDDQGQFVGLRNFSSYLQTPSLLQSLWNSIWVSSLVTFIVVPLAFVFAYALTRSCMPGKTIFRAISLIPLLAPSLLSAISLIYWFGNQGVLKDAMQAVGIDQIYGAPGVVIAECFAVFPHVLMILVTALTLADARLYEAADALGTSAQRKFFTITLPGAKYGLISASLVSFTLVMTDFGIPKVIGGNFNMMATDIFKLVIGQQDFSRGSVVALLLLSPAVISFGVDRYISARQTAMLSARAVAFLPKPNARHDLLMMSFCTFIACLMLAMLGMAVFASFASFWPYNLTPSLIHYKLGLIDGDVGQGFVNSLKMASGTAVFGTLLVFVTAYLLEKTKGMNLVRAPLHMLAVIPMAVPGLVLGLGYIFFFNMPSNPLHGMYQSMTLLTLCTIVHFYTTGHLTATTALKSLDAEFESVSASLKVPFYKTFWRVTLPICTPAMVDIARYFFINAMTTISAVVFLYSPENKVAAIAILNLDEAGDIGAAAAMAVLIALISACATVFFAWLSWLVDKRTQAWRRR